MISCTEFIPAYSELFTFLEKKHGKQTVRDYWEERFDASNDGTPLAKALTKAGGIGGCFTYWKGTLNEEAADFTMYLNEKAGWFFLDMHYCPSKGRLLELQKATGVAPYEDYCQHCDYYRRACERAGLTYSYNFLHTDRAACSITVTDPKRYDGRMIADENTEIMDRKASDNEYLHRWFHTSLNNAVDFLRKNYGASETEEYLSLFAREVYVREIAAIRKDGFAALSEFIRRPYAAEHAEDACDITVSEDGSLLTVKIARCPAVTFLKEAGVAVSPAYSLTTSVVMETIAKETGLTFTMKHYDEETGAAEYCFRK